MAVLAVFARLGKNFYVKNKIPVFHVTPRATITAWHKDWKPGPYPRTKEQRIAAAKKYNLLPEDYEPHPEEEGFGDYPKLPPVSAEARNPFVPYDFPSLKRNYGEPLHVDFDIYKEDMINVERKFKTPFHRQVIYFVLGVATFTGLVLLGEKYKIHYPLVPKQYPKPGVTHYTFEPANE